MSGQFHAGLQPRPLNDAHDYNSRKIRDERYYEILESRWLQHHRCTFPVEMLSTGQNIMTEFDPCKKSITFKIPPTRGTGWHNGSMNQQYKDLPTPLIETKQFPLWSKLWTQYKIDKYEFRCNSTQEYKAMLDETNMKDLSDNMLSIAMGLLGTYDNSFCVDCGESFGSETSPLLLRSGTSDVSDYLFGRGDAFQVNCFPSSGWMALLPMCAKSMFMKDEALNEVWNDCCKEFPPKLSGMVPDMMHIINGVTPVFIRDSFFEKIEVEPGVYAHKVPVFHADALAYWPALLDETMIDEDKEEDGYHFRKVFFYFMQVVQENMVANDWIVFERGTLTKYYDVNPQNAA